MKLRKPAAILATTISVVLLFTGCGKMTANELAVKTAAALISHPVTAVQVAADLDLKMDAMGVSTVLGMDLGVDAKFSQEPYRQFTETTMKMNILSMEISEKNQSYTHLEDGKKVTYAHQDSLDAWLRHEAEPEDDSVQSAQKNFQDLIKKKALSDFVLADQTQQLDGREVYVLSCTFTGDEIRSLADDFDELEDRFDGVDLSTLSVPVVSYIDVKSFLPVKMEMEFQGLNEALADAVKKSLDLDMESLKMNVEVTAVKVVCNSFSYDPVDVPEVPQEALDNWIKVD